MMLTQLSPWFVVLLLAGSQSSFDEADHVERWVQMWNSYDLDQVNELFVTDARVTYFSSEKEGLVHGIDAVVEHHRGFGFVSGGKTPERELWVEEVRADDFGDTAVVTAIWFFGNRDLKSDAQRGPMTMVYVRVAGEYRLAHLHFATY